MNPHHESNMSIRLTEIIIYPVKGMSGIPVNTTRLTPRGLEFDRRWMVVNQQGQFLSQRTHPMLATIVPRISANSIELSQPQHEKVSIPLQGIEGDRVQVKIWKDECFAVCAHTMVNEWITGILETPAKLVYMPDDVFRGIDTEYRVNEDDIVSFADGYPMLMISRPSLEDLNRHLVNKNEAPVPMNRFRPNFVADGCEAYAEDRWESITIGNTCFHGVKPCSRCIVTTIDQGTGVRGTEPFQTLREYRRKNNKVFFGQNLIPCKNTDHAVIHTGDGIEILRTGSGIVFDG